MNFIRFITIFFATLFILGTVLTLLLTLLTGGTQTSVLAKLYWLQTDCSHFPGAPVSNMCRWTSYGLCSVVNGRNKDCTHAAAAYPFSPSRNFNSDENLPQAFINNSNYYYYTSRVGYGFTLVGTAFVFFSWFPFFAMLFRKFYQNVALKAIFWTLYSVATILVIVGVSLTTASYSKGKSHFKDAGIPAKLGSKSLAVAWVSVFLLLFNIIFLALSLSDWSQGEKYIWRYKRHANDDIEEKHHFNWFKRNNPSQSDQLIDNTGAGTATVATTGAAANTDNTTNANYLSFTPVKDANAKENKPASSALTNDGDDTLYP